MKNFLKKCLSLVLVAILAAGTIGTYLPGASAKAEAAETPKYMAKMVRTTDSTADRTGQIVAVEPGKTYIISFQMYVIKQGRLQAWINESSCIVQGADAVSGKEITKTGTYTVPDGTTSVYFNFQVTAAGGEFYIWDIKFTEQGSNENLLANADFTEGDGSWIGWKFTGWGGDNKAPLSTDIQSQTLENSTGRKVILYNEDLLLKDLNNREQFEFTGHELTYMAKIPTQLRIENYVSVPAVVGDTYVLSFNHYNITASNMQLRVGYSSKIDTGTYFTAYNNSSIGQCKTGSVEYTLKEGEGSLTVRIEGTGSTATGYVWGLSLTKKGGDGTNLLHNANFCDGGGSWIGWNVSGKGNIQTVAKSEEAETEKNCPILAYNPSVFNSTNTDIALWSVQPVLEESLDLNYKTILTKTPDAAPTMTFVMTDGEETVKESIVTGTEIGTNKYSFNYVVLPQHMANTITATLKVTVGGVETTETKTYSVKQYCGTLLSCKDNSAYMKNLIADLMRYGAQTQATYGKEDSITSVLRCFVSGYGSNAVLANADYLTTLITGDNSNATYKWKSASLVLDGKVTIRLKFTTSADISGLTVKVNGKTCEIKTATRYYYVDIPMAATAFDDTVEAKFYEADTTEASGATVKYSVNTYLYRKRDNAAEKNLLQAIYKYGQSAEVYNEYIIYGTIKNPDNEILDNWDL